MISFSFLGAESHFWICFIPSSFSIATFFHNTILMTSKLQETEMDPTSDQPSPKATDQMTPLS